MQLMDKLEAYKAENPDNDAVIDDVAAKAYIENFALETFTRAEEAQRSNKVTRQTADTFQASVTFMDVLTIWGPLEQELAAKSKFAKFHALRIAKAIKAGEDPNATNPVVEQPREPDHPTTELSLEEELKNMENDAAAYKSPTVHSVPESAQPSRPHSTLGTSPMAPQPPALPIASTTSVPPAESAISPVDAAETNNSRAGSVGGGYFPVPDAPSNVNAPDLIDQPPSAASPIVTSNPADFYNADQSAPTAPSPGVLVPSPYDRPERATPHQAALGPPSAQPVPPPEVPTVRTVPAQAPPPPSAISTGPPPGGYRDDDDAIMAAQKHAKWAISALNFEDVPTAVKELRIALQSLGAS